MKSKQRRKANRNFILGARTEILVILGQALMNGGKVCVPDVPNGVDFVTFNDYALAYMDWQNGLRQHERFTKKMLSAGLIDPRGHITPKGMEVLK